MNSTRVRLETLRSRLDLEHLPAPFARREGPPLLIGATDLLEGNRVVFQSETPTYEQLLASSAVPPSFPEVEADGHLCWDGLFTSNPPVREFTDLLVRPDEIWVVQVKPAGASACRRACDLSPGTPVRRLEFVFLAGDVPRRATPQVVFGSPRRHRRRGRVLT